MKELFALLLYSAFLSKHVSSATDDAYICSTSESQIVCPEDMLCSVDYFGKPVCHAKGQSLPESHCLTESRLLVYTDLFNLTPHEDCDVFSDDCPSGQVCCISLKGHHCYSQQETANLREDFFKE